MITFWYLLSISFAVNVAANSNISAWVGLRGAQIQTTLVLEGGTVYNGTWDGSQWLNQNTMDGIYGYYYHIDLRRSFDAANDDIDSYMFVPEKGERSDPNAPNFRRGSLFNNGYQFYTFGGLADKVPGADQSTVILGKVNQSSASNTRWGPGLSVIQNADIGGNVNQSNFVVDGAYTSMPDQEQGYLFSGMVGVNGGQLNTRSNDNHTDHPTVTNSSFIRVGMETPDKVSFNYLTWPDNMAPRAQGALVWLPYGLEGVLIAIGGNEMPADLFTGAPPETLDGDRFMTELAIYDIGNDVWYIQPAAGSDEVPQQTAKFCTASISTEDGNSHEIFVYGGYSGTDNDTTVRDDVWILSVPAFQWTRLTNPERTSLHGRYGNVCFAPNPSTLITVGGSDYKGSALNSQLIVDVLDLNGGTWTSKYNSSSNVPFRASSALQQQLQWETAGGPGGKYDTIDFLNSTALNTLFQTRYTGKISSYWPYSEAISPPHLGGNNQPIIIAILCTVVPVILLTLLAIFCFRRQRRITQGLARNRQSRRSVFSWLRKNAMDPEVEKSTMSGDTAVENYLGYSGRAKTTQNEIFEAPSDHRNGWHWYQYSQGSPGLSSATTVRERYEIMDNPGDKPLPAQTSVSMPSSISGSQSQSMRSGEVSSPADIMSTPGATIHTSPSELPDDNQTAVSRHGDNLKSDQDSALAIQKGSRLARKPVRRSTDDTPGVSPETLRPGHKRNISSLSDITTLPSPEPNEAKRQSEQSVSLSDLQSLPARKVSRQGSSGRISAYKEKFDEAMEAPT